ncbi:MarR family winged helix-turn-helix transcriptional regulator [Streptomyces sasae]|uniref:MarR family winged helix-turn-helix transcriptional regulator n=1 Tax=Streptomyces sasae TaxID=1266772 RepID=UPI00292E5FE7|nr:MarR family transcriptional regulator [Streptomyces sasae]
MSRVRDLPTADSGDGRGGTPGVDRELLDWWMLVMQGFHATQDVLASELAERFNLRQGSAEVLIRLLAAPKHRMPMTRLAYEARMSSGGFTKVADRLCAAGLTRRMSCDEDRRLTYLELTDQGKDTARAVSQAVTEILRARVLTPLGRDGLGTLADAMRTLHDANGDPGK